MEITAIEAITLGMVCAALIGIALPVGATWLGEKMIARGKESQTLSPPSPSKARNIAKMMIVALGWILGNIPNILCVGFAAAMAMMITEDPIVIALAALIGAVPLGISVAIAIFYSRRIK